VVWHIYDYVQARPLMSRVLKGMAGRVSGVIVNSDSVNADVRALLGPSAEIRTIYNAVDFSRFSPDGDVADVDALAGLPPAPARAVRVGLIGTFARWKGHTTFLRAISLLPGSVPVRAYVIGGPIYQTAGSQYSMQELRTLTAELGLSGRVGFTGFVPDPAPVMRALDIVVHASTRPEPFGMVIAEAMACRRAVVASQAGGATEIFEHGVTALGHIPGNAADLAAAIGQLAETPAARSSLAENGRRAVQSRFGADRLAREIASFYMRLAPGCACPAEECTPASA
jgi:glycosyltransferase involved in cell wall biosynthesis